MSTPEKQYRPLEAGEIIQHGDEWQHPNGEWIKKTSFGEPYKPEPDYGGVYHYPHRRPIQPWQSLYRAEVAEKDKWKKSRQELLAKFNEVTSQRDEAVKKVAHLKDVLADASKNYRHIEGENEMLKMEISISRTMLNGQERRHKETVQALEQFGKEREQSLSAKCAELNANYLAVTIERDRLARWKKEQLTVTGWWQEIDAFVRKHPATTLGDTIANATMRLLKEGDEMRADIAMRAEAWMPKPPQNLLQDIIHAINCRSAENGSNTPDWILGDFLMKSLEAFDSATKERTRYYAIPDDSPETEPPATTVG